MTIDAFAIATLITPFARTHSVGGAWALGSWLDSPTQMRATGINSPRPGSAMWSGTTTGGYPPSPVLNDRWKHGQRLLHQPTLRNRVSFRHSSHSRGKNLVLHGCRTR